MVAMGINARHEDEHDITDEDEEDDFFDYHYSYLYKSDHNKSKANKTETINGHTGDRAPSLSSSIETDSSTEENNDSEIWKTLNAAKKRQEAIRSRLKGKDDTGDSSLITPKKSQPQTPSARRNSVDDVDEDEKKPDSSQALTPDDAVRMVMRRASMASGDVGSSSVVAKSNASSPAVSEKKTPARRFSAPVEKTETKSSTTRTVGTQTEPVKISPAKNSKSLDSLSGLSGISTSRKSRRRRSSHASTGSQTSAMTGMTQFFDAAEDYDDMGSESESDSLSSVKEELSLRSESQASVSEHEEQEDETRHSAEHTPSKVSAGKAAAQEQKLDPNVEYLNQTDSLGFKLVKALPFTPPVFKTEESDHQYDPDEEFERLYGEKLFDDRSFDKEEMDKIYGKFDDDRDPQDREREHREQEYEAKLKKLRKEKKKKDREERRQLRKEMEDDEEPEAAGIGGFVVSSVVNVGATFGLWGGNDEEDDYSDDEMGSGSDVSGSSDEDGLDDIDEDKPLSPRGIFSMAFKPKPAKNPPKKGVAPSRELEIIKKCQDAWKVREKEAAAREARQKELDIENLRMRKEEEELRMQVAVEVDEYREEMLGMGKGAMLAKMGKAAAEEYDDRLAMEETMKQQQQKAEEMQENIQSLDAKGDKKSKAKNNKDDDSETSSEYSYEKGCCCIVM